MKKIFFAALILGVAGCSSMSNEQHIVRASNFIMDANAPAIRAEAFVYDPNAPALRASRFLTEH